MGLQMLDRKLKELEQSLTTVALRVNQLRDQTSKQETELEKLSTEEQEAAAARPDRRAHFGADILMPYC